MGIFGEPSLLPPRDRYDRLPLLFRFAEQPPPPMRRSFLFSAVARIQLAVVAARARQVTQQVLLPYSAQYCVLKGRSGQWCRRLSISEYSFLSSSPNADVNVKFFD